jgi:hypothetical protein
MKSTLCEMGCGRDMTHPRSGLCGPCYSSCRLWQNAKTREERAERVTRLLLYGRRMEAVDAKAVQIGTRARRVKPRARAVPLNAPQGVRHGTSRHH